MLPSPPFSVEEKAMAAEQVYWHVWQQAANGYFPAATA
jgi:hypothetical protein